MNLSRYVFGRGRAPDHLQRSLSSRTYRLCTVCRRGPLNGRSGRGVSTVRAPVRRNPPPQAHSRQGTQIGIPSDLQPAVTHHTGTAIYLGSLGEHWAISS